MTVSAIARVQAGVCPLCDEELEPAQIDVTTPGQVEPSFVDGPPWCFQCDIGWSLETWVDTSTPRLVMSRSLRADELAGFYRPLEEAS